MKNSASFPIFFFHYFPYYTAHTAVFVDFYLKLLSKCKIIRAYYYSFIVCNIFLYLSSIYNKLYI
jgi:hypothetical protein